MQIRKLVQKLKKQRKKIVAISGSFDLLHAGHIELLQEAKSKGDVLIVLLNSDKSIKSYKGPTRPINNQKDRAFVLSALRSVDYVFLFDDINPKKILESVKPDIYCNSTDWGKNCIEREVVKKYGGRMCVLKFKKGYSTTNLVNKIQNLEKHPTSRAVFLDRDNTINLDNGYTYQTKDFRILPKVIPALQKLSKSDYKIIIVTNQSGIGRGYYHEKDVRAFHKWMLNFLRNRKIRIDKIYFCPHHPDDNCECRKPKIGMVLRAARDFDFDLSKSWVIGDEEKDVVMGREANIKTIKLGKKMDRKKKIQPHYYVKNLKEAVDIILSFNNDS